MQHCETCSLVRLKARRSAAVTGMYMPRIRCIYSSSIGGILVEVSTARQTMVTWGPVFALQALAHTLYCSISTVLRWYWSRKEMVKLHPQFLVPKPMVGAGHGLAGPLASLHEQLK